MAQARLPHDLDLGCSVSFVGRQSAIRSSGMSCVREKAAYYAALAIPPMFVHTATSKKRTGGQSNEQRDGAARDHG